MKKFDIEKEIEKTLSSLDNHERIEASPFFYTKVQEGLKKEREGKVAQFSTWNFLQPVLMAIFIFINVVTIAKITGISKAKSAYSLANDYGINASQKAVQDYVVIEKN